MGKAEKKTGIIVVYFLCSVMIQCPMLFSLMLTGAAEQFPNSSTMAIQLIYTLTTFGGLLGTFLSGKLPSMYSKKILLCIFMLTNTLAGVIGLLLNKSLVMVYVASALIGVGNYAISNLLAAVIVENFDMEKRSAIMGVQGAFVSVGGLVMIILF